MILLPIKWETEPLYTFTIYTKQMSRIVYSNNLSWPQAGSVNITYKGWEIWACLEVLEVHSNAVGTKEQDDGQEEHIRVIVRFHTAIAFQNTAKLRALLFGHVYPGNSAVGHVVPDAILMVHCHVHQTCHRCSRDARDRGSVQPSNGDIFNWILTWWKTHAVMANWYFRMWVYAVLIDDVDLLLEGLIDKDDGDQAGEALLGESSDVPNKGTEVKHHHQQDEEGRPKTYPTPQW